MDTSSPPQVWLTYAEATTYTGLALQTLRNLASSGQVPSYGRGRRRRFKREELDAWLTDPDAAMRKFRYERERRI